MIISLSQEGENVMPGKVRVIPANTNEPMKHGCHLCSYEF